MILRVREICLALVMSLLVALTFASEDAPDIQIRYGEDQTIYEYRVRGELREIKVVPKVGPAYYLVRTEEGEFERSATSRLVFPSWKLIEW